MGGGGGERKLFLTVSGGAEGEEGARVGHTLSTGTVGQWNMHKMTPLKGREVEWQEDKNGRRANVNAHGGSAT